MKVKANCRINYNGDWHVYGDVFEMDNASAFSLGDAITEIKEATVIDNTSAFIEETRRRGRRKKTEE